MAVASNIIVKALPSTSAQVSSSFAPTVGFHTVQVVNASDQNVCNETNHLQTMNLSTIQVKFKINNMLQKC